MPFKTTWEPRGVFTQFSGEISGDELKTSSKLIRTHHSQKRLRYSIIDFLDVTECLVSNYDTLLTAAYDHQLKDPRSPFSIAIVATDPKIIELAELYKSSPLMSLNVKIFSDLISAREWAITQE